MPFHRLPRRLGKPCKVKAQGSTKLDKSDAYNEKMKQAMGWKDADPYQYHYDRGLYYHEIIPDLLCGSQPRNVADVAELKAEVGVTTVLNVGMHDCCKSSLQLLARPKSHITELRVCTERSHVLVQLQQDADFQHWGVDFGAVHQRAEELGINLIRRPVCTALHTAITTIIVPGGSYCASQLQNGFHNHLAARQGHYMVYWSYWRTSVSIQLVSLVTCGPFCCRLKILIRIACATCCLQQ